jgi:hypothetical protein
MAVGCFTDVMLHSLKNYLQEHATEPCQLPKDVAAWGAVILRFHGVANLCLRLLTHSQLQQWLHKHTSKLHYMLHCLPCDLLGFFQNIQTFNFKGFFYLSLC